MTTLDLVLEKEKYNPGEKVKGTVKLVIDSDVEIRSVKFLVSGVEKAWYTTYSTSGSQYHEEEDTFFSRDIYNYLKSAATRLPSKKGKFGFARGSWSIPFEFDLPQNALESYNGKNVSIKYKIEASAQTGWMKEMAKKIPFDVVASNNNMNTVEEGTFYSTSDEENQKTDLVIDLQGRIKFYRGETIRGKITIMKRSRRMPGEVEIKLSGIEIAKAGQTETNTIEKYRRTIELPSASGDIDTIPFETI
jgi:hypothetical protein